MRHIKRKRLRRNIKAISPVLAVLMMIAVAIAGSLLVWAWVMGYIDLTTEKSEQQILIQSIANTTTTAPPGLPDLSVFVQNVGEVPVQFDTTECLYVDGVLMAGFTINPPDGVLDAGDTATITVPGGGAGLADKVTVKVVILSGQFSERSAYPYQGGGVGGGPGVTPPPTVISARTPETDVFDLNNGVGPITGFTPSTADGNLLVLTTGHRIGDPDDHHAPTLTGGWTLQAVGYNDPSTGSTRRIVAIFTKISVNGQSLDGTINWNGDTDADDDIWVTVQEFEGATSYTPVGNGGNDGSSGTSLTVPSSPLPAPGADNILAIVGMVWRGNPTGEGFTNGFGDLAYNNAISNCQGLTAYTYTTSGDVTWDTTASWSGSLPSGGALVLFSCS